MVEPLPVETDRLTPSLFQRFRQRHPTGSLTSSLVQVQESAFVVRVQLNLEGNAVVTALAADAVLEIAEDRACQRALSRLGITASGQAAMTQPPSPGTPAPEPIAKPQAVEPPKVIQDKPQSLASKTGQPQIPAPPPAQPSPTADTELTPTMPPEEAELSAPMDLIPDPAAASPVPTAPKAEAVAPPKAAMAESITVPQVQIAADNLPMPAPIDLSDVIAQTDVELKRLAWSVADGREYLEQTYGKRSRHELTDEELLAFLLYLETLPTPAMS
jgi:hypothetical protein